MVTVVIRHEFSDYIFANGFYVRVLDVGYGKINLLLQQGDRILANQVKVCNMTNKAECKKLAVQFFKNTCSNTVSYDHEIRYFLVGAIDRAKRQVVCEDRNIIVTEEKMGIKVSCLWEEVHLRTKISSTKDVKKIVMDLYKKHMKI